AAICTRSWSSIKLLRRRTDDKGRRGWIGRKGRNCSRAYGGRYFPSRPSRPSRPSCPMYNRSVAASQMIVSAFARRGGGRGKSELRRAVRRVTPGQGNLKESGTENTQPTAGRKAGRADARKGGRWQW